MNQDEIIRKALQALKAQGNGPCVPNCPCAVRDFLQLALGSQANEVFVTIFLDSKNRVLAVEDLYRGALTQTTVYRGQLVKTTLRHNAAAVVFAHNRRSG